MDWSALVSLVAVAVTGLSVWIGYRERASVHRQLVYEKQVESCSLVARAMWDLVAKTIDVLDGAPDILTDENSKRLREETERDKATAAATYYEHLTFLPAKLTDSFLELLLIWDRAAHPEQFEAERRNPRNFMLLAYLNAVSDARNALGIDPLSNEISRIVGAKNVTLKW